jgi:hypothetical protein
MLAAWEYDKAQIMARLYNVKQGVC